MLTANPQKNAVTQFWRRVRDNLFTAERLGQTLASLCWIASIMAYGINSSGDWLQLLAASSWLSANIAAIVKSEEH
ncbi:MAG: hypothetical protein AAF993_17705 [Pseudomonadota bacterium]